METGWVLFFLWELYWLVWAIFALITSPENERVKKFFLQLSAVFIIVPLISLAIWFNDNAFPDYFVFFQSNTVNYIVGLVILAIGLTFAVWSRIKLWKNWSGGVEILPNQKLVFEGPYKIVRNPIYTGQIIAILGTVIILLDLMSIMLLILSIFTFIKKSKDEEIILLKKFGLEYEQYKKRVKMLIPFLL